MYMYVLNVCIIKYIISLIMIRRKSFSRVSDQLKHKSVCSPAETSKDNVTLHIPRLAMILSNKPVKKLLISQHQCPNWSAPLLITCIKIRFTQSKSYNACHKRMFMLNGNKKCTDQHAHAATQTDSKSLCCVEC